MELLIYLGKSATVLALFYTVYVLLLRRDTLFTAKRQFLIIGSITSIFLPLVEFTKVTFVELPGKTSLLVSETVPATHIIEQNEALAIYWWQLLGIVYFIGLVILSLRFLNQFFSLIKMISGSASEKIEGSIHIKINRDISPFSFFNYVVYNPTLHSEEELKMILQHEQVHTSQWHSIDILLANFILIFQWMNPFAWLFKYSIEENLEFIADNKTAQQVHSRKAYQMSLVKASSTLEVPALTNNFYQSFTRLVLFGKKIILMRPTGQIKKRIIMLNKSNSKKVNIWKLSIILPLLAVFLWSFNVKEVVEYKTVSPEIVPVEEFSLPLNMSLDALEDIPDKQPKKEITDSATANNKTQASNTPPLSSNLENKEYTSIKGTVKQGDEVYILITKNTTEEELKIHKKNLKAEHNIDFNYGDLNYNKNGELTSISVKFSNNKGANGNYHITDDNPIEDFYFYISEDGSMGFGSESANKRLAEREEMNSQRMEKRMEMMEKRNVRRDERRVEMEVRKEEMKKRMEEQKIRMKEQQERFKEQQKRIEEENEKIIEKNYTVIRSRGNNNAIEDDDAVIIINSQDGLISIDSDGDSKHSIIIDKDTSDVTLATMIKNLAGKGIDFSYSKLRRNSKGEITRIRISVDNGKGSKSTTTAKTDDGEPIDELLIEFL